MLLPQLLLTTGGALRHGIVLADSLVVDTQRIQSIVDQNSQLMAEAASFALAEHLPRAEAQALVKQAASSEQPLQKALAEVCSIELDWERILDPSTVCASGMQISDSIFSSRNG